MENFVNVIRKDPRVRVKINDMLDRYNRLPFKYESKNVMIRYFKMIFLKN